MGNRKERNKYSNIVHISQNDLQFVMDSSTDQICMVTKNLLSHMRWSAFTTSCQPSFLSGMNGNFLAGKL